MQKRCNHSCKSAAITRAKALQPACESYAISPQLQCNQRAIAPLLKQPLTAIPHTTAQSFTGNVLFNTSLYNKKALESVVILCNYIL